MISDIEVTIRFENNCVFSKKNRYKKLPYCFLINKLLKRQLIVTTEKTAYFVCLCLLTIPTVMKAMSFSVNLSLTHIHSCTHTRDTTHPVCIHSYSKSIFGSKIEQIELVWFRNTQKPAACRDTGFRCITPL